jgi:hypothetical protein
MRLQTNALIPSEATIHLTDRLSDSYPTFKLTAANIIPPTLAKTTKAIERATYFHKDVGAPDNAHPVE